MISWAAGLFEGEGSIGILTNRQGLREHCYPRLQLQMADEDVVLKFWEVIGRKGSICNKKPYKKGYKSLFQWATSNRIDCEDIIELFWPYLGERRRLQAIKAGLEPE